jgi:hypothetical protein
VGAPWRGDGRAAAPGRRAAARGSVASSHASANGPQTAEGSSDPFLSYSRCGVFGSLARSGLHRMNRISKSSISSEWF